MFDSSFFSIKLYVMRTSRNWTLEQLALKCGTTKSHIWDLENKPSVKPSFEMVYKLSVAFDTTMFEFVENHNSNNIEKEKLIILGRFFLSLKEDDRKFVMEMIKYLKVNR